MTFVAESKLKRHERRGVCCVEKRNAGRVAVELTWLNIVISIVVGKLSVLVWRILKQVNFTLHFD